MMRFLAFANPVAWFLVILIPIILIKWMLDILHWMVDNFKAKPKKYRKWKRRGR